ncbi:MAG: AAA family ATPase [Alphaproteobacteria bacterium]|nr:AAA family ATPase [Alphaproteobacteria bacterium]
MKIAVLGAQNTGKSTFISDIIQTFPFLSTEKETYRDKIRELALPINKQTTESTQIVIRDLLVKSTVELQDNTIMDRCLIDNYVYTVWAHRSGNITQTCVEETFEILSKHISLIDHYFFIPSAVSLYIEPKENRDIDPVYIDAVNSIFIETLVTLSAHKKFSLIVVSGTRAERVRIAKKVLN